MTLSNLTDQKASVHLLGNSSCGFFIVDKEHHEVVYISVSTANLLNVDLIDLPQHLFNCVIEKDRKAVKEGFKRVLYGEHVRGFFRIKLNNKIQWVRIETFSSMDPYEIGTITLHEYRDETHQALAELKRQKSSILNFINQDLIAPINNIIRLSSMCEKEAIKANHKVLMDYVGLQKDIANVMKETLKVFIDAFSETDK